MNHVERFEHLMAFEPVDRLPVIEWALWWDKTLERWYQEGLPRKLKDHAEIREYLGLDRYCQWWISPITTSGPQIDYAEGAGLVQDIEGYRGLRAHLYPGSIFQARAYVGPASEKGTLETWVKWQTEGKAVLWITLEGFFWYPRTLLGIERHLYTFYDDPDLMHAINSDLLAYNLRAIEQVCGICRPNFVTFAEDMSYNHGPMISRRCFDDFLAPYYCQLVPELKRRGIIPIVDTDGDVTELTPWLEEVGIEGILPLERMAGNDVSQIRQHHPRFKMIGAFDKTVMHLGEDAMRREFERLLPAMKQGGFIPSVDHQTPPDVSLEQYRCYVSLLKEYCEKAAQPEMD